MKDDMDSESKLSQELLALVAREGMVEPENLVIEAKLADLDIISADFIMILMAIEEEYGAYIPVDNELADLETVGDLLAVASKKIIEHQEANPA